MKAKRNQPPSIRNYFVDEAGDSTLFDRKGRILIGTQGCSRYFILGALDAPAPDLLSRELEQLRERLLADPYFAHVPSMQPDARKTALAFHAKDDIAEIRREVFSILRQHNMRFFAVVRDKRRVLDYVRQRNERDLSYHYSPNELYDSLVKRLFKNLLHKDDGYHIYFARRGTSDRSAALRAALDESRQRFREQWNIVSEASINVIASTPQEQAGLQAVDYFLWSLQRFYESRETRYVEYLWPAYRLVHDVDDVREASYGIYYTQKRPLTAAALDRPGI